MSNFFNKNWFWNGSDFNNIDEAKYTKTKNKNEMHEETKKVKIVEENKAK
jgi:hypothetical protein